MHSQITTIVDPDDELELYNEGVAFYGVPGASGWADCIGDVAIHYLGPKWAVFSKIFPFAEQAEAREAHGSASASEERARLLTELEHSKKVRKGLEAQVGALRIERRNQVVGYCVEMAKWQS